MHFSLVAPHAFGTGAETIAAGNRTAEARNNGEAINGRRVWGWVRNVIWLEKVQARDRGQQTLSIFAIDLVFEQMALQSTFLDGVLTFSADQYAKPRVVL
jgi:hypothetical protein